MSHDFVRGQSVAETCFYCFSTSASKATSKLSGESALQERLPTASVLTVSEQVYSYSDTHNRCFTCARHIVLSHVNSF